MTIKEAIQDIKGWFVGEENEQNTKWNWIKKLCRRY
jgi:hypothetical protein